MRLTVLGCWAPYPRGGGACSGYLLQDGGGNILLDIGHGVFSKVHQLVDFRSLRAAVITHFHPDHYADIYALRHAVAGALRNRGMRQPLKLFLPKHPAEKFQEISSYRDAFVIFPIEDLPEEKVPPGVIVRVGEVGPVRLYFLPARHPVPAYHVAVEGSGYLVYSGDTAPSEDLVALAERAHIFLCEASGLDSDEDFCRGVHCTARQAGEMARRAQVRELVLTHFYPEYDLEEIFRQAAVSFGRIKQLRLAEEGETYFVL